MARVGLSELESVLKKSGLPIGSSEVMERAQLGASDAIAAQVPQVGDMGYKDQLAKIAAMDQKLSRVYSDPSSNLYVENPMTRERLAQGAEATGYGAASTLLGKKRAAESQRENLISETEKYYDDIIAVQKREEARLKKLGKGGKKSGKGAKTAVEEAVGLVDPEVAYVWRTQLTADQKRRWIAAVTERVPLASDDGTTFVAGDGLVPEEGYTMDDVMNFYTYEKKLKDEAKKKKSKSASGLKVEGGSSNALLDLLKNTE